MHPLLLLWDIDGTLLVSAGAGEESLRQCLLNRFGVIDDLSDLEIAGRTDTSIADDICRKHPNHGFTAKDMLEAYLETLPICLKSKKGHVCPGVRALLDWSHAHPEVHNALLTGNVRKGAFHKLDHYGLSKYFEFGAFGDDSKDRNCLGPIALERARNELKKDFHLEYTWVIGDTPRDIQCARALGCKVLAVATGRFSTQELAKYEPELVFETLENHTKVIEELQRH